MSASPAPLAALALALVAAAAAAGAVAIAQPRAARDAIAPGESTSAAPARPRAFAFGHERALARALWSRARVAHGASLARGRRFDGAAAAVEAALALDPSFREPYRYVEAFVVAGPGRPPPGDVGFVRRVLDGGAARFPADAELAARAARFLAFVAPAHLEPAAAERWRAEGLRRLAGAK